MEVFSRVTDGNAIVRKPKGVHVQAPLYHRANQIYIGAAGGFIRVGVPFGDYYVTTHPDYQVLELEGVGVVLKARQAPVYDNKPQGWSNK